MLFGKRGEKRTKNLGSGDNSLGFAIVDGQLTVASTSISSSRAIQNSDIFSCVNLISTDVALCPFKVLGGQEPVLTQLLNNKPNQITNGFTFWQAVMANLLLKGNSYCPIYRDLSGNPVKLEFVSNDQVNVLLSDDSQTIYYQFNFTDDRPPRLLNASDVLHFRLMSVDGGILGKTPLISLVPELDLQDRVNSLALNSMDKAINPAGTINVNEGILDAEAKENIRKEFEKANTGANAGRVMVLDQMFTYQGQKVDGDVLKGLLSQIDWTRTQVSKAFAVPMDMLNQESEHSNIDQIRGLYATCLNRYIYPITSEIQNKLLADPNERMTLDITSVVDPDNSNAVSNLTKLATAQIMDPQTALSVLYAKGGI
ncbi:MAG: phage portal protein [Sporolactobacillus sp.]